MRLISPRGGGAERRPAPPRRCLRQRIHGEATQRVEDPLSSTCLAGLRRARNEAVCKSEKVVPRSDEPTQCSYLECLLRGGAATLLQRLGLDVAPLVERHAHAVTDNGPEMQLSGGQLNFAEGRGPSIKEDFNVAVAPERSDTRE